MEQRLINYTKGITRNPGELMAEDGTLLECINLKCEDGELRPMLWPEPSHLTLNTGERLIYIHRGSGYKNYFVTSGSTVNAFYTTADGTRKDYTFSHTFKQDIKFEAIGNTVIILDADGMHYILYKNSDYTYLGQQFPECPISFGLQGELKYYSKENGFTQEEFPEEINWYTYNDSGYFSDKNEEFITNWLMGKVNQFIKEESTDKGRFVFPFLVRYAYRLYDGTLTYHSAPVLMVAGSYSGIYVPVMGSLKWNDTSAVAPRQGAYCDIVAVTSVLDYQLLNPDVKKELLDDWSDIIKSVDVFVSAPIYTYNQNGRVRRFINSTKEAGSIDTDEHYTSENSFVGKIVGGDRPNGKDFTDFADEEGVTNGNYIGKYYHRWKTATLYQVFRRDGTGQLYAEMPVHSKNYVDEKIKSCSEFYFLKQIDINSLSTDTRSVLEVDKEFLSTLTTRELMTDDYHSHNTLIGKYAYAYNGRLNVSDISIRLFDKWSPDALFQYTNGSVRNTLSAGEGSTVNVSFSDYSDADCNTIGVQICIDDGDKKYISPVKWSTNKFVEKEVGLYNYFPYEKVTSFVVGYVDYTTYYTKRHTGRLHQRLNGSVSVYGLEQSKYDEEGFDEAIGSDYVIHEPNKIYTSEVNNPFIFPVSGVNTIGTGDIIRIVSTTKALSQGQFGQFPLLVLTTDGIWAMTVNDEGLYSTKQVLSRDVCNNPDSIVQTDNLVFFTSERGLMAIDGSQVICVSEHMKGLPANATTMPRMDKLAPTFVSACADNSDIQQFLRQSHAGYSYRENALYFTNPAYTYTWVFRISSQTWTKLWKDGTTPADFINDYPDTLMQDTAGNIYSLLTEPDMSATAQQGFAMTRTLKLGDPTAMKRIRQLKNIKNIVAADSSVKYALWGSNDGIRWYSVTGFVGGFKFYRMALFTILKPSESLLGTAMITEKKQSNKLR